MKIGILGAAGRMGQMITREILSKQHKAQLGAAVEHNKSWALGRDIGDILGYAPYGIIVTADKEAAFKSCDVMIDFTSPETIVEHTSLAYQHQKPIVIGTTGIGDIEEAAMASAAKKTSVFYSANMSIGVNLLLSLVEQAAEKLNDDFDIEIFEAHHRHKVDAPSGTALALGHAAAKGRGVKLEDAKVLHTPSVGARIQGAIGMSVFRGGDVVGEHTVTFAGAGERLELTHKATDRVIFARGAIKAALWLKGKPPGLYSMRKMLGI